MLELNPQLTRKQLWDCAQTCMDTQRTTLATVRYCLDKGGKFAVGARIRGLLDLAAMCQTTAEDSRNGSILYEQSTAYCADLCDRCARDLSALADDPKVATFLNAAVNCAAVCRSMLVVRAA